MAMPLLLHQVSLFVHSWLIYDNCIIVPHSMMNPIHAIFSLAEDHCSEHYDVHNQDTYAEGNNIESN